MDGANARVGASIAARQPAAGRRYHREIGYRHARRVSSGDSAGADGERWTPVV